jgi:DNA-binding NtrC family response regulator
VLLPAIDEAPAALAGAVARPTAGRETVMVVDDLEPVVRVARRMLEREGYQVLTASGGEEAIRVARAHPGEIRLVLTDVMMPDMCGPALAQSVEADRPAVKVLFMSGHIDRSLAGAERIREGETFIAKPFTRDELLAAVRRTIDG